MSLLTVQDVYRRCVVDQRTRCWIWQGATSNHTPRLHTFDHARIEKRTMTGSLAMWNIAHGAAPTSGWLVYRTCGHRLCLCPAHLREARTKAEIGAHIAGSGRRKGKSMQARLANIVKALAARGIVPTSAEIVAEIRAVPCRKDGGPSNKALAALHGLKASTVSQIRLRQRHGSEQ